MEVFGDMKHVHQINENNRLSFIESITESFTVSNWVFSFFFIWILWPFQEYFTYIEPIIHQRWAKTGEPREEPPDYL